MPTIPYGSTPTRRRYTTPAQKDWAPMYPRTKIYLPRDFSPTCAKYSKPSRVSQKWPSKKPSRAKWAETPRNPSLHLVIPRQRFSWPYLGGQSPLRISLVPPDDETTSANKKWTWQDPLACIQKRAFIINWGDAKVLYFSISKEGVRCGWRDNSCGFLLSLSKLWHKNRFAGLASEASEVCKWTARKLSICAKIDIYNGSIHFETVFFACD